MKKILLIVFALATALIVAQSFSYLAINKKVAAEPKKYFMNYPSQVAFCGSLYLESDSDAVIPALTGWGNYSWKVTTSSDSAQFYFNQGINMYYSYHLIEAEASFDKATKFDPGCAMAWFGKALAMGPTINSKDGFETSVTVLRSLEKSKQLAQYGTKLEQDLINAMQTRYQLDSKDPEKVQLNYHEYTAAIKAVYNKHTNETDVVSLYADALMLERDSDGYDLKKMPNDTTSMIQSLLEKGIALNPSHPGVNHYYIHVMEGSKHPEMALHSAGLLDTLMPNVAHMTHMPSHIYSSTGHYSKGVKSNETAIKGFHSYLKSFAPVAAGQGVYEGHNLFVLIYCAQMAGNYKISSDKSEALLKTLPDFLLKMDGAFGMYMQYAAASPYFTNVRFGKWDEILKDKKTDTLAFISLMQHFSRGMALSHTNQSLKAEQELKLLTINTKHPTLLKKANNGINPVAKTSRVAQWILTGTIAQQKKQNLLAIKAFRKAVSIEDSINYMEPRNWMIPARQYLGNALIKAGQYKQAAVVFEEDLDNNKDNGWALTGLSVAYQKAGNPAYKKIDARVKAAWDIKDIKINSSVF